MSTKERADVDLEAGIGRVTCALTTEQHQHSNKCVYFIFYTAQREGLAGLSGRFCRFLR